MDDHLAKPITRAELEELLGKSRVARSLRASAEHLSRRAAVARAGSREEPVS